MNIPSKPDPDVRLLMSQEYRDQLDSLLSQDVPTRAKVIMCSVKLCFALWYEELMNRPIYTGTLDSMEPTTLNNLINSSPISYTEGPHPLAFRVGPNMKEQLQILCDARGRTMETAVLDCIAVYAQYRELLASNQFLFSTSEQGTIQRLTLIVP